MMPTEQQLAERFPSTRWSVVLAAGEHSVIALQQLMAAYWPPLFRYARRAGRQQADAEDAVQDFFCRLLQRQALVHAQAERGRFRTFLLTAFRNHLHDLHAHATAACRDRRRQVAMDVAAWDPPQDDHVQESCERAFDADWALTVLRLALADLERQCLAAGRAEHYRVLRSVLTAANTVHIADLAQQLGCSPGATKVALHRLRAQWRACLRSRVAETVHDVSDVDAELRHLLAVIAGQNSSGNHATELP